MSFALCKNKENKEKNKDHPFELFSLRERKILKFIRETIEDYARQ